MASPLKRCNLQSPGRGATYFEEYSYEGLAHVRIERAPKIVVPTEFPCSSHQGRLLPPPPNLGKQAIRGIVRAKPELVEDLLVISDYEAFRS